jgi:hypothetical protein
MMNDTPTTPAVPAVPLVALGDTIIAQGRGDRRTRRYVVTKIARVWITVRPEWITDPRDRGFSDKRFRLDDQTDGNREFPVRFYTLDQWEAIQLRGRAIEFLREQGIEVRPHGSWWDRETELADVIAAHLATKDGD